MGIGMRSIRRSNQPVAPKRVISAADTMNAPTASAMPKPPAAPAVASTAAPGVDHATITGMRNHHEGSSVHKPRPRPSAHIQEPICAVSAPSERAAWNTMAMELVKPTSTAMKPAVMVESELSRSSERIKAKS